MLGLSMNRAIFTAPLLNGLITRVAPARSSFVTALSSLARATICTLARQHPGRQHDIHVVGIGRQHGRQAAGPLNAGPQQHLVVRRIADDDVPVVLLADALDQVFVPIDDDERMFPLGKKLTDRLPHAADAAHDKVVLQLLNLPFHAASLQHLTKLGVDDHLPDLERTVGEDAQPADHVDDDEQHRRRTLARIARSRASSA